MKLSGHLSAAGSAIVFCARRHPLTLLFSLAGAGGGIAHAWVAGTAGGGFPFLRLAFVFWLGIPVSLAFDLIVRFAPALPGGLRLGIRLAPLALIGSAWFGIRGLDEARFLNRYAFWMVAAHCLIAVSPFLGSLGREGADRFRSGDVRSFNLALFERAIMAVAFTHLLYGGISLAIVAMDPFFGIQAHSRTYPALWFAMAGLFQTVYLAAGVPASPAAWRGREKATAMAFLPRFILFPLGLLYLAMLYAYGIKALAVGEWPRGWASSLILVYSGIMLLTLLLTDPAATPEGAVRHRRLLRGLFGVSAPLLALLFLAIGKRISDYGFTEDRYVVLLLAVWLTAVTLAHLAAGRVLVVGLPASLGLFALAASIGPWGAISVSERSQWNRLEGDLRRAGRLESGKLRYAADAVPMELEAEISAQIDWLAGRKRTERLKAWLPAPGEACPDCPKAWNDWPGSQEFMVRLGLQYRGGRGYRSGNGHRLEFTAESGSDSFRVRGFEHMILLGDIYSARNNARDWGTPGDSLGARIDGSGLKLTAIGSAPLSLDMRPLIARLGGLEKSEFGAIRVPAVNLFLDTVYAGREWRLHFRGLALDTSGGLPVFENFVDGILLIGEEDRTPASN